MTINIEEGEEFIINRLMREKRCGTVTRANESTVEFEADVYSAQEMMPWIRTFIGRIEKLEDVYKRQHLNIPSKKLQ